MLDPIERTSLPDAVFERIAGQITDGTLAAGDALPSERVLADRLAVNRGAVREALKRLSQAKLIRIRQGGKSTVLDFRRHAGLDLLSRLLVRGDGSLNVAVARSILGLRAALAPEVARAAATQASPQTGAALARVLETMRGTSDLAALQDLAMDFWQELVDAGDNIAFALAFNSLRETYDKLREALAMALAEELRAFDDYRTLIDAVEARDTDGAAEAARRITARGSRGIQMALTLAEAGQ